jgi:hypothetical protein
VVSAADVPLGAEESAAESQSTGALSGRTAWARNLEAPLREFLRTETGSAAILLVGAVAALVWVNVDAGSYDRLWSTLLTIRLGGGTVSQDLRHWVNDGLMTLFFFVVGLEARREFDLGELRDRRRLALPVAAGGPRCRPTPRSRSGCWRSWAAAFPTACAPSCSPWRSSTISSDSS